MPQTRTSGPRASNMRPGNRPWRSYRGYPYPRCPVGSDARRAAPRRLRERRRPSRASRTRAWSCWRQGRAGTSTGGGLRSHAVAERARPPGLRLRPGDGLRTGPAGRVSGLGRPAMHHRLVSSAVLKGASGVRFEPCGPPHLWTLSITSRNEAIKFVRRAIIRHGGGCRSCRNGTVRRRRAGR